MKRNKHSLSHYHMTTGKMGYLIPLGEPVEVLPGDTIQHATSLLVRAAPLNSPVMHPINVRVHHFYVPLRLIWSNFPSFITGGLAGTDATTPPTITATPTVSSLHEYLGIPAGTSQTFSALPTRAYQLCVKEFYNDEQIQTAPTISTGDGADSTTTTSLASVCWEKDQFTTARPATQLGTAVTLPLGTSATVKTSSSQLVTGTQPSTMWNDSSGGTPPANSYMGAGTTGGTNARFGAFGTSATGGNFSQSVGMNPVNLYADLSTATGVPINTVRHAFALQRYQEARNFYGARYTEYLRYLGVRSSDARLQRPEYLGGGKSTIQFSEVLQTGVTTSGTPTTGVGSLLGHGIAATRSNRYRRFFEEHGLILSLLSVVPKTVYYGGRSKLYDRSTKEYYWQKELENIGAEEIYNREIYAAHSSPSGVFGYNNRYDSYRRMESKVSGLFGTTLKYWNDARIFGSDPALNSTFITANPDARIFQDTSSDHLYIMANHSIQARRLVGKVGNAGMRVL